MDILHINPFLGASGSSYRTGAMIGRIGESANPANITRGNATTVQSKLQLSSLLLLFIPEQLQKEPAKSYS